jgi:hypothetical protein
LKKRSGIILAVIGCIVFLFSMEGWGADWKFIQEDVQGSIWEIDMASISRQPNNIVRVWTKTTHSKEAIKDRVIRFGEKEKGLSYSIGLLAILCTEKKVRQLSSTFYSLDGGIKSSNNSPYEWEFVVPDSLGDTISKEVCK